MLLTREKVRCLPRTPSTASRTMIVSHQLPAGMPPHEPDPLQRFQQQLVCLGAPLPPTLSELPPPLTIATSDAS